MTEDEGGRGGAPGRNIKAAEKAERIHSAPSIQKRGSMKGVMRKSQHNLIASSRSFSFLSSGAGWK